MSLWFSSYQQKYYFIFLYASVRVFAIQVYNSVSVGRKVLFETLIVLKVDKTFSAITQ